MTQPLEKSRTYSVRVQISLTIEVSVADAVNARDASHKAASRALNSLDGIGEKPRILDQEIISARATRVE